MIEINKLYSLGFEEPEAVHLLIYAVVNNLSEKHVKVSSKDKALLQKLNLVKSEITEYGLKVTITGEEEIVKHFENSIEFDVETHIDEYRNLFKGARSNSMGSKNTVRTNLVDFLYKHKTFSMRDVLRATRIYIDHFDSDGIRYIRQADYFIYKQQAPGMPKTSTLLEVLSNPENYKSAVKSWSKLI